MHEYAMTSDLLNLVLREAATHHATKVLEVTVAIGALSLLDPDQVKFCYDILTKNTLAEGSTLLMEEVEAEVTCSCGFSGAPPTIEGIYDHFLLPVMKCPECGSALQVVKGREFTLLRVKLVKPQIPEVTG